MNSDTHETAVEIAKQAGAIVPCSICGNFDLYADDDDADQQAYAMATNAWKRGERGFQCMTREEVISVVKALLRNANSRCPSCDDNV